MNYLIRFTFTILILELNNIQSAKLLGGFALEQISFGVQPMQKVAVIGETGTGKSTLLKTIAGLLQHTNGTMVFNNKKLLGPDNQLVAGVKGIGYLSQHYELWPNYKIIDILNYNNNLSDSESAVLFKMCKIDHLLLRNSRQLSGGERQRIALAKLLVTKPSLLILDEPFTNLDFEHKNTLKQIIHNASMQYNITCILSSHDPQDILPWADKILVMQHGKIIQTGSSKDIYTNPKNDYIAGLLGYYTKIDEYFSNIFKIEKNINYIRPNHIKISATSTKKTVVTLCKYIGYQWEVTLQWEGYSFVCFSAVEFKVGETVGIDLNI